MPDACRLHGSRFVFDSVLPEWRIAIGHDGQRWHSEPKHRDHDQQKNGETEALGFTVIRLRLGLDAIGPDDVLVGTRPDLAAWSGLVLEKVYAVIQRLKRQDRHPIPPATADTSTAQA